MADTSTGSQVLRDLSVDATTGELVIVNGDLVLTFGLDGIRQDIESALRFFMGEWFEDPTLGVDYFGQVLVKNPDLQGIQSLLRAVLLQCPGVNQVLSLKLDVDRQQRSASVSWSVDTDFGAISALVSVPQ